MTNVSEYFKAELGRDPSADHAESFQAMPLDSVCGADCKQAIDTARAFRESVIKAYGDETEQLYPEKAEQVRALVEEVCGVFIVG